MLFVRIAVVICVLVTSAWLFAKAASSLKFSRINMVSAIFYFMLVFNFIGGSLIYVGFRNHYLIQKVKQETTIDSAYYSFAYCAIMLPLVLLVVKKLFDGFTHKYAMNIYVGHDIYYSGNMRRVQALTFGLLMLCTLSTAYVFLHLGYFPLLPMLTHRSELDLLRQSSNRSFRGNQYVKNLFMHTLTPFVSYFAFIYFRITRNRIWKGLFAYSAILSVVAVTYDFSKSPIITYLLGLYLIEVVMGNVTDSKRFRKLVIAAVVLILFFYVVVLDAGGSLFAFNTGPVGRILLTQIATLFLHFEAFPSYHAFLKGASFNGWMSVVIPNAAGIRSGRVVMTTFNAVGVENNTAGVMNTFFVGEAYANFGVVGVLMAPVIFGVIIGVAAYVIPRFKKTPVAILAYVQLTLQFLTIVEGGFVDIFYNAAMLFLMLVVVIICFVSGPNTRSCSTQVQRDHWFA